MLPWSGVSLSSCTACCQDKTMHFSLLLGAVCVIGSAAAQQYSQQSPVPQRPSSFAGASPVQPVRISQPRQRPVARNIEQDDEYVRRQQPVQRQRRPVARAQTNLVQDEAPQTFAKPRTVEDVYIRQRVLPTVAPTLPPTTRLVTPKPVVEEDEYIEEDSEDQDDATTPSSISRSAYVGPFPPQGQSPAPFQLQRPQVPQQSSVQSQVQPQAFQRPAFLQPSAFRPSPQLNNQQQQQQSQSNAPQTPIIRQYQRPLPQIKAVPQAVSPVTRPPAPSPQAQHNYSSEEDDDDEPQYIRQAPVRQQAKPEPPIRQLSKPAPIRQQSVRQPEPLQPRPYPSKASTSQKERKPVVQTVRKYHDENEDGSITWGYENDDGTFKEETIGIDCVTRGKYGYFDPDGVKREYTYQTGIPCDRQAEAEQAASNNEGYIDYTSNTYVLPNGDEIDLDEMVKNRARKPVGKYRN